LTSDRIREATDKLKWHLWPLPKALWSLIERKMSWHTLMG
jgi:hypothetical protein